MENYRPDNIESKEEVKIQCDCDRERVGGRVVERRPVAPPLCVHHKDQVACASGIDSSLLFFFLLLVVIVCQSECDIEMSTLLWFFLLLVVLYNNKLV